jgi:hypothetical protein
MHPLRHTLLAKKVVHVGLPTEHGRSVYLALPYTLTI